ncbi:MAG TPA: hypothetical protein VM577_20795 [Anaerovoracaceae bacterium]|nr:hypothetical protein [Anaerovoracaceae bacterium]
MNLVGKTVKIFLKNGMTVEGWVQEQNEEVLVLKSPQSKNLLIVYKPSENLLMVHVILDQPKLVTEVPTNPDPENLEMDHYEPDPTLRAKKLSELRQEQLKQHKLDVARHLTTWKLGNSKTYDQDYYEQPSLTQLSPINGPTKESKRSATSDSQRVPNVRRKTGKTR